MLLLLSLSAINHFRALSLISRACMLGQCSKPGPVLLCFQHFTVLPMLMLYHISLFNESKVAEGHGDEHHLEESEESAVYCVFLASL